MVNWVSAWVVSSLFQLDFLRRWTDLGKRRNIPRDETHVIASASEAIQKSHVRLWIASSLRSSQ
jgi:hypothetical protein